MISRISTATLAQSVSLILAKQAELAQTQVQLATGLRINTAKDDPVAAGVVAALDRAEADLERFGSNAGLLGNRLALQESVLAGVNDLLARVREIAIQANGGGLGLSDRRAFLPEIVELREALLAAANASDGQGRYLFGGSSDTSPPVLMQSGTAIYVGDQSQRRQQIFNAVGGGGADRDVLARAEAGGVLRFAGEACSSAYTGTVHGALLSGRVAAA